jgi:TP901 family phage tail tape measure protein
MATRDEVLRLIVQTAGDADLKAISDAISGVGTSAGIADPEVKKLVDELVSLNQTSKAVDQLTSLNTQLDTNAAKLEAAKQKVADFQKQISESATPTKQLTDGLNSAQKSVVSLTGAQEKLQGRADVLNNSLSAQGIDTKNLGAAHTQLGQQVSKTTDAVANLAREQAEATEKSKRHAEAIQEFRAKLLELVSVAAAAELALKAIEFGKEQFKGAADVEQIFSRIKALAGEAANGVSELDKKVEEAGKAVNVSTEASANALAALVKNGLTLEGAYSALIPTLQLAKNAQIDIGTASADVTQSIKLFGLQAEDAAHVVDVLTVASKGSAGGVGEFSESLQKVAPAARQAGLNFEETATVLGTLTKGGQSAGNAAKGLKSIFDELRDPTSKLRGELSHLGDSSGDFRAAITAAGNAGQRTNEVLKSLNGAGRTVFELFLQQGPAGFDATKKAIEGADGAAKTFSEQLDKNLNGRFSQLKHAVDAAGESLLKPILKPLQDEFEKLAGKINEFAETDTFKRLQTIIGEFADKAVKAFDKFVTDIDWETFTQNTTDALGGAATKLGDIAETVGKTATAIEAAATAVGGVYHAMGIAIDAGVGAASTGLSGLTSNLKAISPVLTYLSAGLIDVKDDLTKVGEVANDVSEHSFANMQEHFKALGNSVENLVSELSPAAENIKKIGEAGKDVAKKLEEAEKPIEKFGITAKTAAEKAAQAMALAVPIITKAIDPLATQFHNLGVVSQQALKILADDASDDFDKINKAQDGTIAKLADAQNAFLAYAKKRLEAVKSLDPAAQQEAVQNLVVSASAVHATGANDALIRSILGVHDALQGGGGGGGGVNITKHYNDAANAVRITAEQLFTVQGLIGATATHIEEVGKAAGKTGIQINDMKDAIDAAADKAANRFNVSADHISAYSEAIGGLSEKAVEHFNQINKSALESTRGLSAFGEQYARTFNDLSIPLNAAVTHQREEVAKLTEAYVGFAATASASENDTAASLQARANSLADFSIALRNGSSQFDLLDNQSLSGLQAAIDATRAKTQSLADQAKAASVQFENLAQSTKDALDQALGNSGALEDRRYQKQINDLKAAAETAGALNSQVFLQAENDANALHALNLKNIAAQAATQQAANAKNTQQQTQQQQAAVLPAQVNVAHQIQVNFAVQGGAGGILSSLTADNLHALAGELSPIILQQVQASLKNNS